ncbi:MAG: BrnA antitoxin family protein [Lentisphaeria bacterium]|nr:BrnA antitoxin family protein [Lentisphaeria bacterium]
MKAEYDFTNASKNPYVRSRKNAVTIRLDAATIDYFKQLAGEVSLPYQTLINAYLTDCAKRKLKPDINWK